MATDNLATVRDEINRLKSERKAVILAHNYQIEEVQDVADYLGDSLGLSRTASTVDAEVIVFCGVHFMAETASILCPDKTVLLPDPHAGCPMADMITRTQLIELKRQHPNAVTVGYVNTSAEVKAELDICCTSANAVEVVESVGSEQQIIFVPDKYLGAFVESRTGRTLIKWNGYCPTHAMILPQDISACQRQYPNAEIVVHPECTPEVIQIADSVLSTSGMCSYVSESSSSEFIIGTEVGIVHRLRKENPQKKFYPVRKQTICPNMKLITCQKVLQSLRDMRHEVRVSNEIRRSALKALDRMLQIGAKR